MPITPPDEVSEVVVVANRIKNRGGTLTLPYRALYERIQLYPPEVTREQRDTSPCEFIDGKTEVNADAAAAGAANIIMGQNWRNQEYGAIIYRDSSGLIRHGSITGSATNRWVPTEDNVTGITSYSQVIGFIHNHPANTPGGDKRYPSIYPDGSGDWATFSWVQQQVQIAGGDPTVVRQYVIDADGIIRYYAASDQSNTKLGQEIEPTATPCP